MAYKLLIGRWARYTAILALCFVIAVSIWQVAESAESLPLGLYELFILAPVMAIIELPF